MSFLKIFLVLNIIFIYVAFSKYNLEKSSEKKFEGKAFFTKSDSLNFYSIIEDEFSQSVRLDRINLAENKESESKIFNNSILLDVDKRYSSPYLLLSKNMKLIIANPFDNEMINLNITQTVSDSPNFKYFKKFNAFLYNSQLYYFEGDTASVFQSRVVDALEFNNSLCYIIENQNSLLLKQSTNPNKRLRFDYSEEIILKSNDKHLLLVNKFDRSAFLSLIDRELHVIKSNWEDAISAEIKSLEYWYIPTDSGLYILKDDLTELNLFQDQKISDIWISDKYSVAKVGEKLFLLNPKKKFESYAIKKIKIIDAIEILENKLYLIADDKLQVYDIKKDKLWLLRYIFIDNFIYLIMILLLAILLILVRRVREKNTMLKNVFDLPATGIIIHINKNGNVLNINSQGKSLLKLPESVPLGRYYNYYLEGGGFVELAELIEKSLEIKEEFLQKINLTIDKNLFEYFCTITNIRDITGAYKGLLINAIDITEQLERKRLSNWAQLAHDMQTNLSTIKLNAEQIETFDNENNETRVNKILHQSNLLITRVRDIVTVGRSSKIEKDNHSIREIYHDLIAEFDLDDSDIEIELQADDFKIKCDRGKLSRALRNALENAIKYLPKINGKVILKANRDNRFAYLSIVDNGKGMDNKTKENMLNPFFTKGSSKGTGIGTMIMQNVIEQHGGEIIINSEINNGTEIIFKLPNLARK